MSVTPPAIPGLGWANLNKKKNYFQKGPKTLAIPMTVHRSARKKTVDMMKAKGASGIILLKGGVQLNQYDTDIEPVFRQDSWFNYLFGVKEPEFFGAIDLTTGKSTLFMPRLPEVYMVVMGSIHPPSHFKEMYDVDEVLYSDGLVDFLKASSTSDTPHIHALHGTNSDSGLSVEPPTFDGSEAFPMDTSLLFHTLSTARVTKNPEELEAMRYAAYVASNAHVQVMRSTTVGMMEYELEARFRYEIYANGGSRFAAYTSICACGPNAAVLHYGHAAAPNERQLTIDDMALLDMGADYHGYVSDITCSFPIRGKFSEDQRAVYMGVLNAQRAVISMMAPGVSWLACHQAAEREILQALVGIGCLVGDNIDQMMDDAMGGVFMPHGLGHLIGCDTHDVGGYLEDTPARETRAGWKSLRTARILEPNMVLTNEPGCYFIDYLLDQALANPAQARHMNADVLSRFRGSGGVRLEDVVAVTESGVTNLTQCPRTPEEVEAVRAGGSWPPAVDTAPELRRSWAKLVEGGKEMVTYTL